MVTIVNRDSIQAINKSHENNKDIDIGEYRSFSTNELISEFLKTKKNINIAWTKLEKGKTLPVHKHPMESIIIVCKGKGKYIGEYEAVLNEGDIVHISKNMLHGFIATDEDMHCISIQNDGSPIYTENPTESDRVSFVETDTLSKLFPMKNEFENRFTEICEEINFNINLKGNDGFEQMFFGYLLRWSKCFQKLLFLRQSLSSDANLLDIFSDHLHDEIGHDEYLSHYSYSKDMTMESYCSWFKYSIKTLGDFDKAILIHPVLEVAGEIFSKNVNAVKTEKTSEYIGLHSDLDEGHATICDAEIIIYLNNNKEKAVGTFNDSWRVFIEMFEFMLDKSKFKKVVPCNEVA